MMLAGATVLVALAVVLLLRRAPSSVQPAVQPSAAPAPTAAAMIAPENVAPTPTSEAQATTAVDLDTPVETKHLRPASPLTRPAAKRSEPTDLPELTRVRRSKRQLDSDDPWSK
jgi:hypothetical protein